MENITRTALLTQSSQRVFYTLFKYTCVSTFKNGFIIIFLFLMNIIVIIFFSPGDVWNWKGFMFSPEQI